MKELLQVEKSRGEGGVAVSECNCDDQEFGRGKGEKAARLESLEEPQRREETHIARASSTPGSVSLEEEYQWRAEEVEVWDAHNTGQRFQRRGHGCGEGRHCISEPDRLGEEVAEREKQLFPPRPEPKALARSTSSHRDAKESAQVRTLSRCRAAVCGMSAELEGQVPQAPARDQPLSLSSVWRAGRVLLEQSSPVGGPTASWPPPAPCYRPRVVYCSLRRRSALAAAQVQRSSRSGGDLRTTYLEEARLEGSRDGRREVRAANDSLSLLPSPSPLQPRSLGPHPLSAASTHHTLPLHPLPRHIALSKSRPHNSAAPPLSSLRPPPPPHRMPRAQTLSRRNVRGMGSMKKGNLEQGCLWINVKRAWCERDFVRGNRFNENWTIPELVDEVIREFALLERAGKGDGTSEEADWNLPEGWYAEAQFKRGKNLSAEEYAEDMVNDHFLGAETIHVKVRCWLGVGFFGSLMNFGRAGV